MSRVRHVSSWFTFVFVTVDEVIGANVHDLLWRKHLKQRALYEAMGLSRESLARKMRGDTAWLARDIEVAARVLGVEPGSLFAAVVTGEYQMLFWGRGGIRHPHARVLDVAHGHGPATVDKSHTDQMLRRLPWQISAGMTQTSSLAGCGDCRHRNQALGRPHINVLRREQGLRWQGLAHPTTAYGKAMRQETYGAPHRQAFGLTA